MARQRIEVNLEELDRVSEEARQAPLSEDDYQKLKTALHALVEWARFRSTEKASAVLGKAGDQPKAGAATPPDSGEASGGNPAVARSGHGRNGAEAFRGAEKVEIGHPKLKQGDRCPLLSPVPSAKWRPPPDVAVAPPARVEPPVLDQSTSLCGSGHGNRRCVRCSKLEQRHFPLRLLNQGGAQRCH